MKMLRRKSEHPDDSFPGCDDKPCKAYRDKGNHYRSGTQYLFCPYRFACAYILRDYGCNPRAEIDNWKDDDRVYAVGGRNGGHYLLSKGIHKSLKHNVADRGCSRLYRRGI